MGYQLTKNDVLWFAQKIKDLRNSRESIVTEQQLVRNSEARLKMSEDIYRETCKEIMDFYRKFDLASNHNAGWEGRLLEFLPLLFDGVKATNT